MQSTAHAEHMQSTCHGRAQPHVMDPYTIVQLHSTNMNMEKVPNSDPSLVGPASFTVVLQEPLGYFVFSFR